MIRQYRIFCRTVVSLSITRYLGTELVRLAVLPAALLAASCTGGDGSPPPPQGVAEGAAAFTEITTDLGLPQPEPWPDGTFALPEIVGPGVALFDYDGDLDLDLLSVRVPPPGQPDESAPNRLYELGDDGRYVDVTVRSGLGDPGWGHGLAIGDIDDDGDADVYFANFGRDALYLNQGDGTFRDVTDSAGLGGEGSWSTASAFCDYDRDGDLDLFVTHYVRFDPKAICKDSSGEQDYCDPKNFDGIADSLYRNEGDGTFTDVTVPAGLVLPDNASRAKGLGAVCVDLTDDGLADIYVANDGEANQLWVNVGEGTFTEQGITRGVAVNRNGLPEASMGISVGDVDGNGRVDLFVTHLRGENNTLYSPSGGVLFRDRTAESNMAKHDLRWTGFGCALFDYDHDGDLDLAIANGRVYRDPVIDGARLTPFWNPYAEPNLLFDNDGRGRFELAGAVGGPFLSGIEITRGLAVGDLDDDGDLDLVTSNVDGSLRVYRNDAPPSGTHWVRVRALVGSRDAIGASITINAAGRSWTAAVAPATSFLSYSDTTVHFGLGETDAIESIVVVWPDGSRERFEGDGVDRVVEIRRGTGEAH